jgi:uncharacterized protein (DUF1501 family)
MDMTRRSLLGRAALTGVFALTPRLVFAAAPTDQRFVFIILRGAMDGLSVVMPVGDPAYAGLRGALARPPGDAAPVSLDSTFALHPAMPRTAAMYAGKEALFIHAVASPYRERSHFDAQNVLETGGTAAYALKDGWLNRLVAALPAGREPPIAIAATVPMVLRGTAPVTSYAPSALPEANDDLLHRINGLYEHDPLLHPLWSEAMDARTLAQSGGGGGDSAKANPAALGKLAAQFLAKPSGPRIAVIELLGWDTHAQQAGRLANQLRQLDAVLGALRDGMGPEWTKTVVLAATEFGRTAAINGTGGTDHGTGGAAILAGGAVAGGRVVADWPGLGSGALYEGRDLRPTTDLRSVMLGVGAATFGVDPARLAPALFPGARVAPVGGLLRT